MARSSSTRCRKPYGSGMTIAANQPSNGSASRIRRQFLATGDALTALAERSAEVDRLVMDAAERLLIPGIAANVAVLAVGGYGRGQPFPYSDIDVLLLFPSERHIAAAKEAISAFLQHLWDAGLRMSHSVRTPDECAEVHDSNTELNISLLDQRYLTGDRTLYAGLADRLPRFIHANRDALVRNLAQLTRDRHTKYARRPARLSTGLLARSVARRRRRPQRRTARGLSFPGPAALLSAHPERPRQQPAHLRRPGCPGRALAPPGCRAVDARILPARARHLPRRHPRARSRRRPDQLPLRPVSRFPLPRFQRRVQRTPRTRPFPRAPEARRGARSRPAPV